MTTNRNTFARRAVSVAAFLPMTFVAFPSAAAQPSAEAGVAAVDYRVVAEANAVQVVGKNPSLPLTTTLEGSSYGSSARVTSLGESMADAGSPYVPFVSGSAGLVTASLPPGLFPFGVPGYVASRYPTVDRQSQEGGAYSLTAASSERESRGSVAGAGAPSSTSTFSADAHTKADRDGTVITSATSNVRLLRVADVLDIRNVSSTGTITARPGAKPTYSGEFEMGSATLAGQQLQLQGSTLSVFGNSIPVPLSSTTLPMLNAALTPAGVTVTYEPATYTYADGTTSSGNAPDGSRLLRSVMSGGLSVTVSQDVPGSGSTRTEYILGRNALTAATAGDGVESGEGRAAGDGTSGVGGDSGANGPSGVVAVDDGATSTTSSKVGDVPPTVAEAVGSGDTSSSGSSGQAPALRAGGLPNSPTLGFELAGFYLVLVLGAVAALVGSNLVRLLAVRLHFSPTTR